MKNVIVQAFDDKNRHKYLCAYIVSYKEISANGIREELMQSLPDYMIPTYFVQLDALLELGGSISLLLDEIKVLWSERLIEIEPGQVI